jgi:hypothetical protein
MNKINPELSARFGIPELFYLLGVAFLFSGIWIWLGLGQAFAGSGVILIITALISAIMREGTHAI